MPISHKYKAIFIHIPKTGGTSIERMLEIPENKEGLFNCNPKKAPIYQHFVPVKLQPLISDDHWNSYYKFTSVRNPLTRAISDYKFFTVNSSREPDLNKLNIRTFSDYCKLADEVVTNNLYSENPFFDHFIPQHKFFEGITFDKVCRMETFATDVEEIRKHLNCKLPLRRYHASSSRPVSYTPEDLDIIKRIYAKDFEMFNYPLPK